MSDTSPSPSNDAADGSPSSSTQARDVFVDVIEAAEDAPQDERKVGSRPPMGLTEALGELGTISLAETSLTDVMRRVASLAQATIPGADEVSITLMEGERATTVAFTGDLAFQLDERQYEDGYGPCMDAARQGGTIQMFRLDQEERYPGFVTSALRAGVTGSLSVGMPVPSRVVGGLNIYARAAGEQDDPLGPESVAVAEAFAGYAAIALANAGLLHSTRRFADQMQRAMSSRASIEQAKGVLMAQTGCSADEAFAELAQRSRTSGRKLATIAAELLEDARHEPT